MRVYSKLLAVSLFVYCLFYLFNVCDANCASCCLSGICSEAYRGQEGMCCGMKVVNGLRRPFCCPYPQSQCINSAAGDFRCQANNALKTDFPALTNVNSRAQPASEGGSFSVWNILWIVVILGVVLLCCCGVYRVCVKRMARNRESISVDNASSSALPMQELRPNNMMMSPAHGYSPQNFGNRNFFGPGGQYSQQGQDLNQRSNIRDLQLDVGRGTPPLPAPYSHGAQSPARQGHGMNTNGQLFSNTQNNEYGASGAHRFEGSGFTLGSDGSVRNNTDTQQSLYPHISRSDEASSDANSKVPMGDASMRITTNNRNRNNNV